MPLSLVGPARLALALVAMALAVCMAFCATPKIAQAAPGDIVRGTVTSELALYAATDGAGEVQMTLPAGTTLQAAEVEGGWYGARFDVNGVSTPLYFYGLDSLALYTAQDSSVLRGAVVGGDMSVYIAPSEYSEALDVFSWGSTIQFCVFNDSFYMARLSSGQICYIPTWQVLLYDPAESGTLERYAGAYGANVYQAPDTASAVLATFDPGVQLWFADFNADWLMASMNVDGASRTVFVLKSEVGTEPPVIDEGGDAGDGDEGGDDVQITTNAWLITNVSRASGMSEPSWDNYPSTELEGFSYGTVLPAADLGNGWYQVLYDGVTMYLSGEEVNVVPLGNISITYQSYGLTLSDMVSLQNDGTHIIGNTGVSATAADIRTYLNPENFPEGTSGFFQFMRLDTPAGVSISELNAQLSDCGVLAGQGQAFSDAAYAFNVNEAYLISHAIHETGYGSSRLACGLWYDPETETAYDEQREGTTLVYNVYGIGAYDSNPINGGAKMAYEQGWTSVYDAIYGGAKIIASWYIAPNSSTLSGQNTLYKMLWHPEYAATYWEKPWHEYATDVAWAYAQTYYLTQLYADYSNFSLIFEVPSYAGN